MADAPQPEENQESEQNQQNEAQQNQPEAAPAQNVPGQLAISPAAKDIGGRLKKFHATLNMSMLKFERSCKLSNGTLGKIIAGKLGIGHDKLLGVFRAYPQINAEWLILGRGPMLLTPAQAPEPYQLPQWADPVHLLADTVHEHIADPEALQKCLACLEAVRKNTATLQTLNYDLQQHMMKISAGLLAKQQGS